MPSVSEQLCIDVAALIQSNAASFSSTPVIRQMRAAKLPDLADADDLLIIVSPDQQQVGTVARGMAGDVFVTNIVAMKRVSSDTDGEPTRSEVDVLMQDGEKIVDLFRRSADFAGTTAYPGGAAWESCSRDYIYEPDQMRSASLFVTSVSVGYTIYKDI